MIDREIIIKALMLAIPIGIKNKNKAEVNRMRVMLHLMNHENKTKLKRCVINLADMQFLVFYNEEYELIERVEWLEGGELTNQELVKYYNSIAEMFLIKLKNKSNEQG